MFQYQNNKTIFHRTPVELKIIVSIIIIVTGFVTRSYFTLLYLIGFMLLILLLSRYPLLNLLKLIRTMVYIMGLPVVLLWYFIRPPEGTIEIVVLRVVLVFFMIAFMTSTTDLITILEFLKKIRLPRMIYLSIYIMLRFMPEIEYDYRQVRDMMKVKGIRPGLSLSSWSYYLKSFFVPMVIVLLNRADEIAIAAYLREL